jgi:histidine ammonia-lyase
MQPGAGTHAAYGVIRKIVPHLEKDRVLSEDVKRIVQLIRSGEILDAVENAVGTVR